MCSSSTLTSMGIGMIREFLVTMIVLILRLLASFVERALYKATPQEREETLHD